MSSLPKLLETSDPSNVSVDGNTTTFTSLQSEGTSNNSNSRPGSSVDSSVNCNPRVLNRRMYIIAFFTARTGAHSSLIRTHYVYHRKVRTSSTSEKGYNFKTLLSKNSHPKRILIKSAIVDSLNFRDKQ